MHRSSFSFTLFVTFVSWMPDRPAFLFRLSNQDDHNSPNDESLRYGHNYAPEHYIDAWISVTDPPDWAPLKTERLKE